MSTNASKMAFQKALGRHLGPEKWVTPIGCGRKGGIIGNKCPQDGLRRSSREALGDEMTDTDWVWPKREIISNQGVQDGLRSSSWEALGDPEVGAHQTVVGLIDVGLHFIFCNL